ncbi:Phosphoribosyl-ATP cyclohydrolase [Candidatus Endolissoclinum faulkneri L2]|uniref:Phosphoribosyl-AMP cyclohydrolase n=1 Tax=Candidatus Endolissoclinum faulkneri L2 TaxID=1193729 RepID=K7YLX1_9PROT|nr:phosphoribosyl-AMP cyclohydrolase [Candidatus Endolissoclinum faulkneri]AFX98472.1 Phosphoribosyl-ATP cyclohydrolase [Candidatus Endolissoclinum faulkneri L2]
MNDFTVKFAKSRDNNKAKESSKFAPEFKMDGLIPAIVLDVKTNKLLMMAWMDTRALSLTILTSNAHYYSRSRKKIWLKGESSGHIQLVKEIRLDCDQDTVLLLVEQVGSGACHLGYLSCFYRKVVRADSGLALEVVENRNTTRV